MKWRYRIAIGVGVVIVIIVAGIGVLFHTPAGLRWTIGIAEGYLEGTVRIERVEGTLAGPIEIEHLRIELGNAVITVGHAKIDWSPWALVTGNLRIRLLTAHRITARIAPPRRKHANTQFTLPEQIGLPLHIIVASARLHDIEIITPKRLLAFSRIGFSLNADDARIKLTRLDVVHPRFTISGRLRLEPHGNWKIEAKLEERARLPGYPAIGGHTRVHGALRGTLALVQKVGTPFNATLAARVKTLFSTPAARGTLHLAGLNLRRFREGWPNLTATAAIHFHGSAGNFNARGTAAVHGERSVKAHFDLRAGVREQRLHIAHLNVAVRQIGTPARPPARQSAPTGQISLHGKISLSAPHAVHLKLAWHDLGWPLGAKTPIVFAPRGVAILAGSLHEWSARALSRVALGTLPPGRWLLAAHGTLRSATVTHLFGRWLEGSIAASGKLSFANRPAFKVKLRGRSLDLGSIRAPLRLPQQTGFNLAATGSLRPLVARLKLEHLSGRLHGQIVTGHADVKWSERRIVVHQLELSAGRNHFTLHGRWGRHPELAWQLHAPELRLFAARLGGHIQARGTVTGTRRTPFIQGRLSGGSLHWRSLRIRQVAAQGSFKAGKQAVAAIDVVLRGIRKGRLALGNLVFSLSGPANAQHFTLRYHGKRAGLMLAGTGRLLENAWRGSLREGRFTSASTPTFRLQEPVEIVLGKKRTAFAQACWQSAEASGLCFTGHSGKSGWQAAVTLDSLPLELANPFLHGMRLHGKLDGHLEARGAEGHPHVLAMLHVGPGGISRHVHGKTTRFKFDEAGLEVRINASTAQARLGVLPALGGLIDVRLRIPWRSHPRPTGQIRVTAHLPDLSHMDTLSTAISDLSGRLDAEFRITGRLEKPLFSGRIILRRAAFTLSRFGTHVESARFVVRGDGPRLTLSGHMKDGETGHLTLRGRLTRRGRKWALDARIEGEHFQIADSPVAQVVVSPHLDIGIQHGHLNVSGEIVIPSAHITPPHFATAITPAADMVIVGKKTPRPEQPIAIHARITLRLGDDVHFKGFGLNAQFGGQLTLIQEPHELATATGEIKIITGRYKAYGIKLKIVHGALFFTGGWVGNPSLSIRAERAVGTVTVGLHVTGSLRHPRMEIYSNPPMPDPNALAYLLFGHGVRENSGSENSLQAQAANALGIATATFLAKSVGKYIDVDTVTVESISPYRTGANQASLFLGEYLTPRLYVSYGIGLYKPIKLLRVHYKISRHWALRAVSGTISGADILFNIAF